MNPLMPLTPNEIQRLAELSADGACDQLSVEEVAELEELLGRATASQRKASMTYDHVIAGLIEKEFANAGSMPAELSERIAAQGRAIVGRAGQASSDTHADNALRPADFSRVTPNRRFSSRLAIGAIAASLLLGGAGVLLTWRLSASRQVELQSAVAAMQARERSALEAKAAQSQALAMAESKLSALQSQLREATRKADQTQIKLAEAMEREIAVAKQLVEATSKLSAAELKIAKLEAPIDPVALAAGRTKLLEVPGTIRVGWKPFDLPEAPAEQPNVQGDVVWNDELEQGYLRFVGLKVNDPRIEQYQVWVIDERGMEQKVSGGVFNANADGEIVVPIDPAIDMRRVALFAVTIEEPGGTWVPSLKRRVVVAPRAG